MKSMWVWIYANMGNGPDCFTRIAHNPHLDLSGSESEREGSKSPRIPQIRLCFFPIFGELSLDRMISDSNEVEEIIGETRRKEF